MALTQVDQGLLGTYAQYTGFKNRLINGQMQIDQRNNGASVSMASGDGGYCLDRWRTQKNGAGTLSLQQVSDAPTGFSNSLKITVTGTSTPSAGDYYTIGQIIEGFNTSDLNLGTASSPNITISFWVKGSVTGTYIASVYNWTVGSYAYPASFTINSANTWEYKTITLNVGTSTGTWSTTNTGSIYLRIDLGSGSSFNAASANTWNSTGGFRVSSAVSLISNASATLQLTGVQLEKGSTATSFDYRPYGTELQLCQRYYENAGTSVPSDVSAFWSGNVTSGQTYYMPVKYVVTKRTTGAVTLIGSPPVSNFSTVTVTSLGEVGFRISSTATGTGTGYYGTNWSMSAEL